MVHRRRPSAPRLAPGLAAVLAVTTLLASCSSPSKPSAAQVLSSFMAAWNGRHGAAMSALLTAPDPALLHQIDTATAGLGATAVHRVASLPPGGPPTATVVSTYQLPAIGAWRVTTKLTLQELSGNWRVAWAPTILDPSLPAGGHLKLTYQWDDRAAIIGAGNTPLTSDQPQVVVGIEGSRIKNKTQVSQVLSAAGATAPEISAALAVAAAHPDYFAQVFTLSQSAYNALGGNSSELYKVPGTVFNPRTERVAATPGLAAHLVGTVGQPTAQQLAQLGPAYSVATLVGQGGLEAAYQHQLAGTPGATVDVVDAAGHTVTSSVVSPPVAGTPVTTSIDVTVQKAAESALASAALSKTLSSQNGVAALIAVKVSTGEVLASADLPASGGYDDGFDGAFPPGSTFKILTSTALLDAGLTPSSPASCPPTVTVDGEVFHNAEGEGAVSNLLGAFTESCNTAFVQLVSSHLTPSSFTGVAQLYGLGTKLQMGYPAFSGSVPRPTDAAGLASTAIGQAQVTVSPLNMAEVAAAVGSGTSHPARLVQGAPADRAPGTVLPAATVSSLRQMMASVVASSSGTAHNTGLPAGTYAKTGTAEYGNANPLPIDSWLVGYDGEIAFAMVQQDSKLDGGPANGPVIAKFLDALPASVIAGG